MCLSGLTCLSADSELALVKIVKKMFEIPDKIVLAFGGLSLYQIYKQYNKN